MILDVKTTFTIDYAEVEVCEDSYDKGEGDYVNSWSIPGLSGKEYDSLQELVSAIHEADYVFSNNIENYTYIDHRIDTDAEVDVDNCEPSEADYQMWRNGDLMLYVAHLCVGVTVNEYRYINCKLDEEITRELTEEDVEDTGMNIC